jgi:hypothetical protein
MDVPHEHGRDPCHPVLLVDFPGFSTVADIRVDVGATH